MTNLRNIFAMLFVGAFFAFPLQAQNTEWQQLHQGNKAFRSERYDEAITHYLSALKASPQSSRARFNLGDCYLAKGDPKSAMEQFDTVVTVERNPTYKAMAYHNRGYILQKSAANDNEKRQQLLRQAIGEYKNALRLNPRDEDTRYNLALCQKQLKDEEQGQQQQEQEPQQGPDESQTEEEKQPQNPKDKKIQTDPQTQQYLNLSRQAERRALEKIQDRQPRAKSLDKNW